MKRNVGLLVISMMLVVSAHAADPTVDEILNKYMQALGGKAAIEKLTSRVSKGTVNIAAFNVGGTVEVYEKAPGMHLSVSKFEGFGEVKRGCNGKTAWTSNPMGGVHELTGEGLEQAKRSADFHRHLKLAKLFAKIAVTGKEKVGDREAYVLEATPASGGGAPEKFYFDVQTGLLLRLDTEREVLDQKQALQFFYDDYREVDGVKIAFSIKQVGGQFTIDMKLTEVKHNVAIDDAKFAKPAQ